MERGEQGKLHGGQRDGLAVVRDLQSVRLECQETAAAVLVRPAGSSQDGLDAGHQLPRAVRFTDIVVGTQLEPQQAIDLLDPCRGHDDGHLGAAAHLATDAQPVLTRQHEVE